MGLQQEIDKARAEIKTDGYSMSIGEWISLYEKDEIDIHPEFQRFFRWSPKQKSRLIESILLGIPIPQIFVSQRPDGIWDVVDGLQRLSTIYQFVGLLKNENGDLVGPLILESTQYLPSLKGKYWDNKRNIKSSLDSAQRLIIKRSKIDVSIILKESDDKSKYELFQRLNTGGSPLSEQEVRNSILVMLNRDMFRWMKELTLDKNFKVCVALSDRATEEQYDMELVLRFLVFRELPSKTLRSIGDMGDFLTDQLISMATKKDYDIDDEEKAFRTTFKLLKEQSEDDTFRRYDADKNRFVGGFSVSAYETIALGVGYNYQRVTSKKIKLIGKIKKIWTDDEFTNNSGSGVRASSRVPKIIPYGRKLFSK